MAVVGSVTVRAKREKVLRLIPPTVFDVDNMMRVLPYSSNLWTSTVDSDLPKLSKHIKAAWDNRTTGKNYMQILTNAQASSYVEGKPAGHPASAALTQ